MEIDQILEKMVETSGKRKSDLKKTYNAIEKAKIEEGLDKILPEEHLQRIILSGVIKKYEIAGDLESFLTETNVPDPVFGDEEKDDDVVAMVITKEPNKEAVIEELVLNEEGSLIEKEEKPFVKTWEDPSEDLDLEEESEVDWKQFMKTFKSATIKSNVPSLRIMDNVTYYARVADVAEKPYHYKGVDQWGKDFESYSFNIVLKKVSPEEFYAENYETGENIGKPLYIDGQNYKLWLRPQFMSAFMDFWRETLKLENIDSRIFAFRRTKKMSKNQRKYSIMKFFEVKSK